MPEFRTISRQNPAFPDYLDFESLRQIGIDHLQRMSGKVWTDYNLHDPGVTILEILCYAVTDLGYRNNLEIQDLLTQAPGATAQTDNNFFTPDQILTCNPVTSLDLRKRLIDIEGVRNAWVERFENYNLAQSWIWHWSLEPDDSNASGEALPSTAMPLIWQLLSCYNLLAGVLYLSQEHPLQAYQLRRRAQGWMPTLANSGTVAEAISLTAMPLIWHLLSQYDFLAGMIYLSQRPPVDQDSHPLNLKGLHTVLLDLEPPLQMDGCCEPYEDWGSVLRQVKTVLDSYRNLCEDVHEIIVLGQEQIGLRGTIELDATADANAVLVEIFIQVGKFLAPEVKFYTLQELLERGKDPAEIFAGRPSAIPQHDDYSPYRDSPSHGFIDNDELAALTLPKRLHTSDLYQIILDVPGVITVNTLSIRSFINGVPQSEEQPWYLDLMTPNYRPVLGLEQSHLSLFKGGLPTPVDMDRVKRRYTQHKLAHLKAQRNPAELDLPVPRGTYLAELQDHYSIHHDFPLTYGISEDGLPSTEPTERQAKAKQLKGYLVFFDQILANYLAQLAHIRELFSWQEDALQSTYFSQPLNFPGYQEILKESALDPQALAALVDTQTVALDRKNRLLDHMLARFAESFTDYVLLNYRLNGRPVDDQDEARFIHDKAHFLQEYPLLSRDRFRAADYCVCRGETVWNSRRISGFEKRTSRLLGMNDRRQASSHTETLQRRSLVHYEVQHQPSEFILHLVCGEENQDRAFLQSRKSYPTLAAAQTALETLLNCLTNPSHYRKLIYRNAYHSFEIVDDDGTSLAFYHHSYPTESARNADITPLVETVQVVVLQRFVEQLQTTTELYQWAKLLLYSSGFVFAVIPAIFDELWVVLQDLLTAIPQRHQFSQGQGELYAAFATLRMTILEMLRTHTNALIDSMFKADHTDQGEGFILTLSSREPQLRFISAQRYITCEEARRAATRVFYQIQEKAFYHPISLRSSDVAPGLMVEGKLITYGFAIADSQGTILADMDSSQGFDQAQERDQIIEAMQQVETQQTDSTVSIEIQQTLPAFVGQVAQADPRRILLQSTRRFTYDLAKLIIHGPSQADSPVADRSQRWQRVMASLREHLHEAETASSIGTERILRLQINRVEADHARSWGYRFRLVPSHPPNDVTWQFDSPPRYSTYGEAEKWGNYARSLLKRHHVPTAMPPLDPTLSIPPVSADNPLYRLQRQTHNAGQWQEPKYSLVILDLPHTSQAEADAWQHGDSLIRLAEIDDSYRRIDTQPDLSDDTSDPITENRPAIYSWALASSGRGNLVACPPTYYTSHENRDQAIKILEDYIDDEGLHVVEHILLRPRSVMANADPANVLTGLVDHPNTLPILFSAQMEGASGATSSISQPLDPYSFWMSVVLPAWPRRFQDRSFRQFVERTLRLEAPAHVALKIAWVDLRQMKNFETAYRRWLEQLAMATCEGATCLQTSALNELIAVLSDLCGIYPTATLSAPDTREFSRNPIRLNQTHLGTTYD
jgi:hypothetical protein